MKKKMMSLVSVLFLSLFLVVSASASAPIDGTQGESSSKDITWAFTKFDADGNIIEEGIVPMQGSDDGTIRPQMIWRGITLENNESVTIYPKDSPNGLYAVEDTEMTIKYQLSRSAKHYSWIRASFTPPHEWRYDGNSYIVSGTYTTPVDDYYIGLLKNLSSDEFTINYFEISF